ncbi:OmpA family protein [Neisseria leonii]|uniref:OmpA family protein n=1 Tax=Neisseria leonii TaxID=2995413 RepID=A0A9X4E1M3_9NEIS|nr:OmpA family protein [Neisseria sp. 51.81]MDD9327813.1 OmpA family protein [Neisseria sp. 51.81]
MKFLKPMTLSAAACAMLLTGCVTNADGSKSASKTAMYSLGGAAACGVVGALTKGSKGARNAALACGAVGAGVGGYMDYQEAKLRDSLKGTPVEVSREGNQIKLTMPSGVTFATNSATLNNTAVISLNSAAETLVQYPETTITIVGHTDNTGSLSINQPLSERRAQAVAAYLTQRGVAASRLSTVGYADSRPVAANDTEAGRAQNRRVEILINPTADAGK